MESNSETVDSLLAVNRLTYGMPPAVSVATARRQVQNFPQVSTSASGTTIIYNIQSGDQFVYGPKSYLRMVLSDFVGGVATDRNISGVGALFDRITVSSRSGVELCRIEAFDVYMDKIAKWFRTQQHFDRLQAPALLDETDIADGTVCVLPLNFIPFFAQDRLLPPEIMEGMIIRFDLSTAAVAFRAGSAVSTPVASYNITSRMNLDCTVLADQYRRAVASIAASDGLIMLHEEAFYSQVNATGTGINFDIKKSASKATGFMTMTRDTAVFNKQESNHQASEPYNFSSLQLQVGSQYYPQAPLTQTATGDFTSRETYYYVENQIGDMENKAGYDQFFQVNGNTCNAVFYQDLTDASSAMSGIVLNGSRALLANITMGSALSRRVDSWLFHLRLVRAFSNNTVVRD